jgi:hypothetical protein
MKFGVREICDVVFKAKATQKVGNKVFYKNEPVIYFDTLKTSTLEGAVTTSYATGGRGNSRLIAWDGERTVTFTMEDALISPEGIMILTGAGLIEASAEDSIKVHVTEQTDEVSYKDGILSVKVAQKPFTGVVDAEGEFVPSKEDLIYVMILKNGEVASEPFIASNEDYVKNAEGKYELKIPVNGASDVAHRNDYTATDIADFEGIDVVLVDYYTEKASGAKQIDITPDKFGGNYYVEASTLFRDTNGVDMPAEFVIPNCKVQSNFTFSMASSGDPSTFSFTMDAFPDYTRFNKVKKVLADIQIVDAANDESVLVRTSTKHDVAHEQIIG